MTELRRTLSWLAVVGLGVGLCAVVVRLAWLSDDAYITLRCVENLLAGHGPVWNVGERVQTYTHPAWFWLLAAGRWLSGEHYFTTLGLSFLASGAAVVVLVGLGRSAAARLAVLLALLGSRAFGDFATSGLETPLAMLLLALLAQVDANTKADAVRLFAVGSLCAWLGTTRLDLLLLAGPVLLAQLRPQAPLRQTAVLLLALAPLLGWSVFATCYYGSPFPITAYAKALSPGVPAAELAAQGWRYTLHTLQHDPVTLGVIVAGVLVGLARPSLRGRCLALGVLLSCLYVVRVGGDFMAGRFFVPPFVAALALLARGYAHLPAGAAAAAAGLWLGLPWLGGAPPWLQPPAADTPTEVVHGIQDERRFYYGKFGLLAPTRVVPTPGEFSAALRRQGRQRPIVLGAGMAGGLPFLAGDLFHFVDPWLCDPLLMRLPIAPALPWRIGHFTRAVPDGYAASVASGENRIEHSGLRRYYATLRTVLRAPLDAAERHAALWDLLTGADEPARLDYVASEYHRPVRREATLEPGALPLPEGTFWFDAPTVRMVGRGGLRLRYLALQQPAALHLTVVPLVRYRLTFRRGAAEVGRSELLAFDPARFPGEPPRGEQADVLGYLQRLLGMQRFRVELPPQLPPFDTIDVDAEHQPWELPALGGIELGK